MSNSPFTHARDFLQARLSDYEAAYDGFRWPVLEHFNWAHPIGSVLVGGNASGMHKSILSTCADSS